MLTPALLEEIGQTLDGSAWQTGLGKRLGIAPRSILRWWRYLQGHRDTQSRRPPDDLLEQLQTLLREKRDEVDAVARRVALLTHREAAE